MDGGSQNRQIWGYINSEEEGLRENGQPHQLTTRNVHIMVTALISELPVRLYLLFFLKKFQSYNRIKALVNQLNIIGFTNGFFVLGALSYDKSI